MDNIWLYIIIFGAIISLAQKGGKQTSAPDSTEQQPSADDWEKTLRELLGKSPADRKQEEGSEPTAQHSSNSAEQQAEPPMSRPIQREVQQAKTVASKEPMKHTNHPSGPASAEIFTHKREMSHIVHSTKSSTINTKPQFGASMAAKSSKQNNPQVQIIDEQSGSMESIIGDFSMEKAVIYAEILKPKYEEY